MAPRVDKVSRAKRKGKQVDIENEIPNWQFDSDTAQDIEEIDIQADSRPSTASTNAVPAEETPVSKRLRLEAVERKGTEKTADTFLHWAQPLTRPDSHGNDHELQSFSARIGIQKPCLASPTHDASFSFAPVHPNGRTSRVTSQERPTSQRLPTRYV